MQRLCEMINRQEEKQLIFNAIKDDVALLALDPQGNYVLLILMTLLTGQMFEHIVEQLID